MAKKNREAKEILDTFFKYVWIVAFFVLFGMFLISIVRGDAEAAGIRLGIALACSAHARIERLNR